MSKIGISKEFKFEDGRTLTVETGKLAKQADGSVVVRMGDTMLLATVVSNNEVNGDIDFMPLTVDYREKFAAAGRMPGGYLKREARPSDDEILVMRLVDRALRPLFPDDYHGDTQLMIQLMSYDKDALPDALACLAASCALSVSDIPFNGPVSEVRVSRVNGEMIINPTQEQMEAADIDMMIAGTIDNIVMVEGEMKEISEQEMVDAIAKAHEAIKAQCQFQLELAAEVPSANPKREYCHERSDEELKQKIHDFAYQRCYDIAKEGSNNKDERATKFSEVKADFIATLEEEYAAENAFLINQYFGKTKKEAVRTMMLDLGQRLDGRKSENIRDIWSEVDYLPGTHGSSIFTRGETQSLTSLTLGNKKDEQMVDRATGMYYSNFLLHYNFPPFSTGEARPIRGVSRREIGHGNLALRALKQVLPAAEDFPYTIRLVSEILESNGSSSMATVCAGTLALMDGGVPIKAPVTGIAMGLITEGNSDRYMVLSDILGDEDHLGDMDFKITGTREGITACQMDIKVDGLSFEILTNALLQARDGRLHIMDKIEETLPAPNTEMKPNAPRMIMVEIPGDCIGAIIGPGGKNIQELQERTGTEIAIEENKEKKTGEVYISGVGGKGIDEAEKAVRLIAFPPKAEIGETYTGVVKSIMPYGAFVEVVPGTQALLHVSEYDWNRIESIGDFLKENDEVEVKVTGLDPKTKKLKLSRKVLLPRPEKKEEKSAE